MCLLGRLEGNGSDWLKSAERLRASRTQQGFHISDTLFSRDLSHFSRDFTYVHWNIPTCSPIRIFIFGLRYVSKLSYGLFKNRSFGGVEPPEGLKIVLDILRQNFLEIRILTAIGAGSDQPCSAGLGRAKMHEFFSRIVKAGEGTCRCAAGEMS